MRNTTMQRFGGAALALTLLGGLSACGDDDEDAAATTESTTGDSATDGADGTDGAGGEADLVAACAAEALLNPAVQTGLPEPEGEVPTDEETQAIQDFAAGELLPLLDDLAAVAPEDAQALVAGVAEPIGTLAETGDPEIIFGDGPGSAYAAFNELAAYFYEECDDPQVAVSAVDYAFEGDVPTEAGLNRLRFTNDADEIHEMVLFRRNDDEELSFPELLELGEEEADGRVEFIGAAFGAQGDVAYAELDLTAGDYAMVCFVPTGTVSEADFETNAEAPPHFTQGMIREFTVEG